MKRQDENCLFEQLKKRDPTAFATFVRQYEQTLLRTAFRILGQQTDAEEVRQNVLMRIWRSPENLPVSTEHCDMWIRRCVINEAITMVRKTAREKRNNQLAAGDLPRSSEPDLWQDESDVLRWALCRLTPEQRALLSLRFDEQLSIRQIGETLQLPHTTIQTRLQATIKQLRAAFQVADSKRVTS